MVNTVTICAELGSISHSHQELAIPPVLAATFVVADTSSLCMFSPYAPMLFAVKGVPTALLL